MHNVILSTKNTKSTKTFLVLAEFFPNTGFCHTLLGYFWVTFFRVFRAFRGQFMNQLPVLKLIGFE
jgi:hypothetical protein